MITAKEYIRRFWIPASPRNPSFFQERERDKRYRILRGRVSASLAPRRLNGPTRYAPNQSSSKSAYEAELVTNRPAHLVAGPMKHDASTPYQRLDYSVRSYYTASARCRLTFHSSPDQRPRDRARSTGVWTRAATTGCPLPRPATLP
ncbi:unnamed protein product [Ectocarpus sp. 8 AP-2014]